MDLNKIKATRFTILLLLPFYIYSWVSIPIHLQSIAAYSEYDGQRDSRERASFFLLKDGMWGSPEKELVPRCYRLWTHDDKRCPICTLAQNKVLYHSIKSQMNVIALDGVLPYKERFLPIYSFLHKSIRAPPL